MRTLLYAYNPYSEGARRVARALGVVRLRHKGSKYKAAPSDFIVNWGSNQVPMQFMETPRVINMPSFVDWASNKLRAYTLFSECGVPTVPHCTDRDKAREWLSEGKTTLARMLLRASEGRGVQVMETIEDLVDAPLYTQYIKKKDEYRVFVIGNNVACATQKRKRRDVDDVDYKIRNYCNGWVFCHENAEPPPAVTEAAVKAVQALRLDFGAADVGWNEHKQAAYVYEVNTAPLMEGTTLELFAAALNDYINSLK